MKSKTGRKQKHHVNSQTGKPVVGLSKMTDGRWRVIGSQIRFAEADEQRAIEKFYRLTEQAVALTISPPPSAALQGSTAIEIQAKPSDLAAYAEQQDRAFWQRMGDELRNRPKFCAQQTGIEQLAYLTDLKPPEKLPTFKELEQLWKDFYAKSKEQKRRVLHAWADFKATTKATELKDITPQLAISYRDTVYARKLTGKMQENIFTRIRRLLSFAKSRAVAVTAIGQALEALSLLTPDDTTVSLDPKPIEVDDWKKLLGKAEGEDKAMIMLMLNGAFYGQEVVRLKWSEIKGNSLVTHRSKEGKCVRVCNLWAETLEALKAVKRKGDYIFYSYQGTPLGAKGADKRFRVLRDKAELTVTSSQLRDGAATAAAAANVNEQMINLLLGHRSGINDHYIKRAPQMAQPASDAIYKAYFG